MINFTSSTANKRNYLAFLFFGILVLTGVCSCSKDDGANPKEPENAKTETISQYIDDRVVLEDLGLEIDYRACGTIKINDELIIKPGVSIEMCSGAVIKVLANGSLKAEGTSELPISFLGKKKLPGYWNGIKFYSDSPNNVLNHVVVKHGGGGLVNVAKSNVYVGTDGQFSPEIQGRLTIKNTLISESENYGLTVGIFGSFSDFANNTFSNNGNAGIVIPANLMGMMDSASDYATNNEKNYIEVRTVGGTLTENQVVNATNAPFFIRAGLYLSAGLILEPGVIFLMDRFEGIIIGSGYLKAEGTEDNPIIIKGAVEEAGYWGDIIFYSDDPNNILKNVKILHGGASGAAVDVYEGSLTMTDCIVSESKCWGLIVNTSRGATIFPGTKQELLNVNTFNNNGGSCSTCEGDCSIFFE